MNQNEQVVIDENSEPEQVSISTRIVKWFRNKLAVLLILLLIAAMILVFFWNWIVITVKSGEAAVLFEIISGTKIDKVYTEGLHIFSPFDTVYIYEIRKKIAFHEFDVISNKGLTVNLSLAIRYRPEVELLGLLHQKIGPDYLSRVILPQIESVMRKQLGDYTAEQIYTNEACLLYTSPSPRDLSTSRMPSSA